MRHLILAVLAGMSISYPALAWHDVAHRYTAELAFASISAATQREVTAVLREHPRYQEDFAAYMPAEIAAGSEYEQGEWLLEQASIWPDLARDFPDDERSKYNRSTWHYINRMVWLESGDEEALRGKLDHNMATNFSPPLRQSLNSVQALRGNLEVWRDSSASMSDRAIALCWILHLVGDMHQPLHNVALFSSAYFPKGDRGGNSVKVSWGDQTSNLHAVWDGIPSGLDDLTPTARTLRSIEEDVVDDAAIEVWLSDHARIAERFVYTDDVKAQVLSKLRAGQDPVVSLSHEYLVAGESIARRQVNLAGHRIAALLD